MSKTRITKILKWVNKSKREILRGAGKYNDYQVLTDGYVMLFLKSDLEWLVAFGTWDRVPVQILLSLG